MLGYCQSPQNFGILGSRIPKKVLERANGASSKTYEAFLRATEVASKNMEHPLNTDEAALKSYWAPSDVNEALLVDVL